LDAAQHSENLSAFVIPQLRESACRALYAENPGEALLSAMNAEPSLRRLLDDSAGVFEGYTVGLHHAFALEQLRKYRLGESLPIADSPTSPHIGARGLVAVLGTHDLAKFVPNEEKNKSNEHRRTLEVLDRMRDVLPFSDVQWNLVRDLIANNDLGDLFRGVVTEAPPIKEKKAVFERLHTRGLTEAEYLSIVADWERHAIEHARPPEEIAARVTSCADSFRMRAELVGVTPSELLRYQLAMFQSDVSSYTWDACARGVRGSPSLDYLFVRGEPFDGRLIFKNCDAEDRLRFSPFFERVYLQLAASLGV
jgi:hypothetical protein